MKVERVHYPRLCDRIVSPYPTLNTFCHRLLFKTLKAARHQTSIKTGHLITALLILQTFDKVQYAHDKMCQKLKTTEVSLKISPI